MTTSLSGLLVVSFMLTCLPSPAYAGSHPILLAKTPKPKPAGGNVYDLIALVNQLRAQNGLAPFQANGALMAAAQAHSQYQAAIGSTSHTGSGGSSVKGRALAAGYGAGADVSVIENVYAGMGASPQNAVSWWQGDGPHLATILSTRHTEVGAGMAESGGVVYYTLDVGSVLGGSAPAADSATIPAPAGSTAVPNSNPAASVFNPVVIATARSDGSLVHLVQPGQTLWTIAASYKLPLSELLQINGFTESSLIFPGDQILIKTAAKNPTTLTPVSTSTIEPQTQVVQTSEQQNNNPPPESSITTQPLETPLPTATSQRTLAPKKGRSASDMVRIFILVCLMGGAAMFAAGMLIDKKR